MANHTVAGLFVVLLALVGYIYFFQISNNTEPVYLSKDLTLTYFNLQGRGEPIRLLLEYYQIPYQSNSPSNWSEEKKNDKYLFGQLPHLQNGEYSIVQMNAILSHLDRQISKKHGIKYTEKELVQLDSIGQGVEDFRGRFGKLIYGSISEKDKYLEALPGYLRFFENILMKNGGFYGKGWYLINNDFVTYVDISLWDLLDKHLHPKFSPSCLDDFPMVTSLFLFF